MAHESFEDPDVAAVLNRHFIAIKVDREERPDIDDQYMAVAQMTIGSGGWPLTIFMDAGKRPFFAATYLPRTSRAGMPGIIKILERVADLWNNERQKLVEGSSASLEVLSRYSRPRPGPLPDLALAEAAYGKLTAMYDGFWGGFGNAPKFPMPLYIGFLLRFARMSGTTAPLPLVEQTLCMLRQGGIYDQLGFGFHRYATDRQWLVPHFEKMLYDQALIAVAYLETFQMTGNGFYLQVAEEIFSYVLREMTAPEGGFYTALDADTAGEEGAYYLWTPAEIALHLAPGDAALFCRLFDVTTGGNFEGRSIPHLMVTPETFAIREELAPVPFAAGLERWRQTLLGVRNGRPRPFRDEKVLTAWNGLMIEALARGYALNGDLRLLKAAARGAEFIARNLVTTEGLLLRSFHRDRGEIPAFLEDYAFLVGGLLALHQVTLAPAYLDRAVALTDEMLRLFAAEEGGSLYDTGSAGEFLPVRQRSCRDGALPSGNGIAALNLFRLGRITGADHFTRAGEAIVRAFMGDAEKQPLACLSLLAAADYHLGGGVVITLTGKRSELGGMLRVIHRRFIPGLAIRHEDEAKEGNNPRRASRPSAFVCAAGVCHPPAVEPEALAALLDSLG
jgi:uncharacterized protein YyaL (SSP411 family)